MIVPQVRVDVQEAETAALISSGCEATAFDPMERRCWAVPPIIISCAFILVWKCLPRGQRIDPAAGGGPVNTAGLMLDYGTRATLGKKCKAGCDENGAGSFSKIADTHLQVCPGEAREDRTCAHDTYRVCLQLLRSTGQPLLFGVDQDWWEWTNQSHIRWDDRIRSAHGRHWCTCALCTAEAVEQFSCNKLSMECNATDVAWVLAQAGQGAPHIASLKECLLQQCPQRVALSKLQTVIDSADVVVFEVPTCPYCIRAMEALKEHRIDFKKVRIDDYRPALMNKVGKSSAPSVWVKGTYVGGCDDGTKPWHGVLPMLANGRFQHMLKNG